VGGRGAQTKESKGFLANDCLTRQIGVDISGRSLERPGSNLKSGPIVTQLQYLGENVVIGLSPLAKKGEFRRKVRGPKRKQGRAYQCQLGGGLEGKHCRLGEDALRKD